MPDYDNVQTVRTLSGGTVSLSLANYVPNAGSNRMLVVMASGRRSGANPTPSAVYNGNAMAIAALNEIVEGSSQVNSALFYALESSLTATGTISVDWDGGGCNDCEVKVFTLFDVVQQGPEATATLSAAVVTSFSGVITASTSNAIVIEAWCKSTGEDATAVNSQTIISETTGNSSIFVAAYRVTAATTATMSFGWSFTTESRLSWVAASFSREAASGGVTATASPAGATVLIAGLTPTATAENRPKTTAGVAGEVITLLGYAPTTTTVNRPATTVGPGTGAVVFFGYAPTANTAETQRTATPAGATVKILGYAPTGVAKKAVKVTASVAGTSLKFVGATPSIIIAIQDWIPIDQDEDIWTEIPKIWEST